jgi:hypothetical protein
VIARVPAHAGAPSDFSYGTLYQSGYPLLLVPIYWFTGNPVTVYHVTMVVNAVVNAARMPLAYRCQLSRSAPGRRAAGADLRLPEPGQRREPA